MRTLLVLFLVAFYQSSDGQPIKFQLRRITFCHPQGAIDSSGYALMDEHDSLYRVHSGTVSLPKTGNYRILMWSEPDTKFPVLHIDGQSYTYTYREPKIVARSYGIHGTAVYETCGQPIEGY